MGEMDKDLDKILLMIFNIQKIYTVYLDHVKEVDNQYDKS